MEITKVEHSCLIIREGDVTFVTDPGSWNDIPDVQNLDAILITHEHGDHIQIDHVQTLLAQNPRAVVITHAAVGKMLSDAGIAYRELTEGEMIDIRGVSIQSIGKDHAIIYGDVSPCRNTGFLIAKRLYMPGDALHDVPDVPVEILALPTGGPWMKISDAIDYAKKVKPKTTFPIHDGMYKEAYRTSTVVTWITKSLEGEGIEFRNMLPGAVEVF